MSAPLRILHLTDPHLHADRSARMRGVATDATLVATLAHALAHPRGPDVLLATGDLVQDDSRAAYERFRELTAGLGIPVLCLPGNHDVPELMADVLRGAPYSHDGAWAAGNWQLILLNTWQPDEAGGCLSSEELLRLEHRLDANPEMHALIALHHQPVPMGSRWLDTVGLHNAGALLKIVDSHASVRGVVWGHVHQESERTRRGVRLMSTPSTCAQFLPGADEFALDARPPGYRWIDLHPDGRIVSRVVWAESSE